LCFRTLIFDGAFGGTTVMSKMEGKYKLGKENDERKCRNGVKGVEEMSLKIFSNKELKRDELEGIIRLYICS
jgi:hypothetical protein